MSFGKNSEKVGQMIDVRAPMLSRNGEVDKVELEKFKGASFSGSVFNLSCTIVGAGIMSLPSVFKLLGVVPGIALVMISAFLTEASIEMLLRFSKPCSAFSYGDVMGDAFGTAGRALLQICVIINNIGAVIIYLIIIGVTPMLPFCYISILQDKISFSFLDHWSTFLI